MLAAVAFAFVAFVLAIEVREAIAFDAEPSCRAPIRWPARLAATRETDTAGCRDEGVRILAAWQEHQHLRRPPEPLDVEVVFADGTKKVLALGETPTDAFWDDAREGRTPIATARLFHGSVVAIATASGKAATDQLAPHNVLPIALGTTALGVLTMYAFVRMRRLLRAARPAVS